MNTFISIEKRAIFLSVKNLNVSSIQMTWKKDVKTNIQTIEDRRENLNSNFFCQSTLSSLNCRYIYFGP